MCYDCLVNVCQVAKGSHIYEFGDHGGLIVMVKDTEATNTCFYSWNEGETWTEHTFSQTPMNVNNIIIEVHTPTVGDCMPIIPVQMICFVSTRYLIVL